MEREEAAAAPEFFEAVGATVREGLDEAVSRAGSADSGLLTAALGLVLDRVHPAS